jgi:adenylate cyclase
VYVIEDAHWIDSTSESLLADFLSVVPRSRSLVLITFRPEYGGALSRPPGAQTIALAPLDDAETVGLVAELLGPHPSVDALVTHIAERASGNPFFAEELVRDLVGRGVLAGERGSYTSADEAAELDVPATLQAVIAARIDRLETSAKLTLNAAAVIGMRFDEALLAAVADDPNVATLVRAEIVDPVTFTPRAEYAFRHPLIRTVAYRSQLKSARAQLHRRLAAALQARDPDSMDENAALIAEHLEAAGDLPEAFGWHMRAGGWLTFRDVNAARLSWLRARQVADRLPADYTSREGMRIAPRALLCGSAFRVGGAVDEDGFEELRRLAGAADDKMSLALAMAGHVMSLVFHARYRESSQLANELTGLLDSFDDAGLAVGLLSEVITAKLANGEVVEALRLAQRTIDITGGDAHLGDFIIESPLTVAKMFRATARMCLGANGWKSDMDQATTLCRENVPLGRAVLLFWRYGYGVSAGAIRPDAAAVRETAEVLELAKLTGDNLSLESGRFLHGFVLAQQDGPDRGRGLGLLATARDAAIQHRTAAVFVPLADIEFAKEKARTGDLDEAIQLLGTVIEHAIAAGGMDSHGAAVEALVELLLERGTREDVRAAKASTERLAAAPTEPGFVVYDIALLRLRALLALAQGDEAAYRDLRARYRARAIELGFEGHIDMAAAMP